VPPLRKGGLLNPGAITIGGRGGSKQRASLKDGLTDPTGITLAAR